MSEQQAGGQREDVIRLESPFHWVNAQGMSLRLQVMLVVRDPEGRVLLAQTEEYQPGHWWIPAETLRPNEPVKHAGSRVSTEWLGQDVEPEVLDVLTWPADVDAGHRKWYIVHVFEATVDPDELDPIPEDVTIEWVEPGQSPPGPWAADHGTVWKELFGA